MSTASSTPRTCVGSRPGEATNDTASDHIPEIREFLQRLPELIRDVAYAVRDAFARHREAR